MKTYTFEYKDIAQQTLFDEIVDKKNILVQIFCGNSVKVLQEASIFIKKKLPQCNIIGTTTDGEINNSDIHTNSTIIAISIFANTHITCAHVQNNNCFDNGISLATKLIRPDTKLLILFTDGSTSNGEEFLKGIESVNNKVIICGGMAGDNGKFIQTYICENEHILENGAVGVSLNSENLTVFNDYKFDWSPIGIEHRIDEIKGNRVYKISGMTALDFYEKYLGSEVAKALPKTGIEFPLIIEKNDFKVARAVIARHNDGSLSFAGNLKVGDKVRLGFGNVDLIMRSSYLNQPKTPFQSAQSFFVYSCMARRRYMPSLIKMEMNDYAQNAPTVGFFSYAEFYHHKGHNELLNQTFTVVGMCESDCNERVIVSKEVQKSTPKDDEYALTIGALAHLVSQSTQDYDLQRERLEQEKRYSQTLLKAQDLFIKHAVHETNTPLSVIMCNIDLYESEFGPNSYVSNIEIAMKNVFIIYDDLSYLIKNKYVAYPKHTFELIDYIKTRIEFFDIMAKKRGVKFVFSSVAEELFIYFNESKLQRIIDNNLTNAIKYTQEFETIYVVIEVDGDNCEVIFKSKSSEIENPEKVFEDFYRESEDQEGFGLGLNLVNEICKSEGVAIELHSDKEETSFKYKFKVVEL